MQQPPPRKVKHSAALKSIHAEQVCRLQAKHQQECDLLEDIRTFSRHWSAIEKEYGQGLLKLTSQLLRKEFTPPPCIQSEDGKECRPELGRTAIAVWRQILEETEKIGKSRLQAAEILTEKVSEPAKSIKATKMQCLKKVLAQLTTVQSEVAQSVMEMTKGQKMYIADETQANEARLKATEAEEKLKRKSVSLFQSMTSLKRNCDKLGSRREQCEMKSTGSRNEYLLSQSAANAHHIHYYSIDLPGLMQMLDGEVYEKIREFFLTMARAEVDISSTKMNCFQKIAAEADKISRQYCLQCFLYDSNMFTELVQYEFEPCLNDQCRNVSKDHNADHHLEKEARKWAAKIAKENKSVKESNRLMKSLMAQTKSDQTSEAGMETTMQDLEQKIEELRQNIRKAETAKMKAEARIEILRVAGVNVEEWLASAQVESLGLEGDISRTPSQVSLRTESSGGHSEEHDHTYTHFDEEDDFADETDSSKDTSNFSPTSRSSQKYPIKCQALYDFKASNDDELELEQHQQLELIADGDGDGWVQARNSQGKVGYIPESYIFIQEEGQQCVNVDTVTSPPLVTSLSNHISAAPTEVQQDVTSSYSSGDLEIQQATSQMPVNGDRFPQQPLSTTEVLARALYDYEGNTDDELTFMEGAIIKILRKDENGIDDGFWEGELNGRVGVFPSLVVEELADLSEDTLTPVKSGPPDFVPPPPVTVTLATPDREDEERIPPLENGTDNMAAAEMKSCGSEQIQKRVRFSRNHIIRPAEMEEESDEGEESIV